MIPPVQADKVVTTTTRPAVFAVSVLMARVEPALKPYHPSHRIKVPSTCMQLGRQLGSLGIKVPSTCRTFEWPAKS